MENQLVHYISHASVVVLKYGLPERSGMKFFPAERNSWAVGGGGSNRNFSRPSATHERWGGGVQIEIFPGRAQLTLTSGGGVQIVKFYDRSVLTTNFWPERTIFGRNTVPAHFFPERRSTPFLPQFTTVSCSI
jgi:hypothetical protein